MLQFDTLPPAAAVARLPYHFTNRFRACDGTDRVYLAIAGDPPRLMINRAWWHECSRAERYAAVIALREEDLAPPGYHVWGTQCLPSPNEPTHAELLAAQLVAWWEALLAADGG